MLQQMVIVILRFLYIFSQIELIANNSLYALFYFFVFYHGKQAIFLIVFETLLLQPFTLFIPAYR